jgi:hypothetical protein
MSRGRASESFSPCAASALKNLSEGERGRMEVTHSALALRSASSCEPIRRMTAIAPTVCLFLLVGCAQDVSTCVTG